jgi:catalase
MEAAAGDLFEEIVDAIADLYGAHPGKRAVHAKGTLLAGTFAASGAAARLSVAPHFQGEPLRATVRFSNGSGDPSAPDGLADGRGMALKVYLPGGGTTDVLGLTLPCFFVRTPEAFLEFTRARRPDPETGKPDLARVGAFVEAHPESLPALQAALAAKPIESYARRAYNGIHAFRLVAPDGTERAVRWRLEPEAEVGEGLDADEARVREPDYLQREILERAEREGVRFRLVAILAEPGDPEDDPTLAWPDEREAVELGRIELTGPDTERERGDDVLVFDPTRVPDGIRLTADPILHARPRAYSVSVERRTGVRA